VVRRDQPGEHAERAFEPLFVRLGAEADTNPVRIVAGMDVSQVAEVMGRSEGSVRVLVHRGLHRLRDLIGRAAWMVV